MHKPERGYSSTNDGNSSLRLLENFATSGKITGVDENLIKRFYIFLLIISSDTKIDTTSPVV